MSCNPLYGLQKVGTFVQLTGAAWLAQRCASLWLCDQQLWLVTKSALEVCTHNDALYKLRTFVMLFACSLVCMGWITTRPAQKLLVWVKFTGNPYSYACEQPPLKYMQTRICRNSYTGTQTMPDSYSCLCEHSCSLISKCTLWWCWFLLSLEVLIGIRI